jgi:hypothetical protein
MGTFKDRENYLKQLCTAHPIVLHDVSNRKSYFRLNNEEELASGTVNGIDYPCVANTNLTGRIRDKNSDTTILNHVFSNEWSFLQEVATTDSEAVNFSDEVQDAYDLTFEIMEDFIKAMKDDYAENDRCGAFDAIDFSQMNYRPIGPVMQNAYGWELSFINEQKATRIN